MARWVLLGVSVLLNVALILVALSPSVVTYAEVPPKGVSCPGCDTTALARAAEAGRAQIQSLIASNTWILVGLAIANLAVVVALIWVLRSNSRPQLDARTSASHLKDPVARAPGPER